MFVCVWGVCVLSSTVSAPGIAVHNLDFTIQLHISVVFVSLAYWPFMIVYDKPQPFFPTNDRTLFFLSASGPFLVFWIQWVFQGRHKSNTWKLSSTSEREHVVLFFLCLDILAQYNFAQFH